MRLLFKFVIGISALFIAGCSAFFSVRGLGLLFVGSATAVMIMAASLEVGKLVAASLLYQYWARLSIPVRLYLMVAVGVLVCITSLGIYGYLARAYERTNSDVALLQQQIDSLERELADTQHRIDSSRTQVDKLSDTDHQEIDKLEQQVVQTNQSLDQAVIRLEDRRKSALAKRDSSIDKLHQQSAQTNQSLEQGLTRLDDRRKAVRGNRDHEIEQLNARTAEADKLLTAALASEDAAIAALNERIAVLDRAVDAYTREGGAGFLKDDSIKKGAILRQEQQPQRDAIAAEIAQHQQTQSQLRKTHDATIKEIDTQIAAVGEKTTKDLAAIDEDEKNQRKANTDALQAIDKQIAAAGDQYAKDTASADDEEKSLRKTSADTLAAAQQQIASIRAKSQTDTAEGSNQIEAMYQRLRTGNDEIQRLKAQIANTDVGSYRFVARALDVPVDTVVKWLMLVIVLVFDPLAVALTIGFNVVIASDRRRLAVAANNTPASVTPSPTPEPVNPAQTAMPGRAAPVVGAVVAIALATGLIGGGIYVVTRVVRKRAQTAHAALVPDDCFAVVAFRPAVLRQETGSSSVISIGSKTSTGLLSQPVAAALSDLLSSGFDPNADVYAFMKYPAAHGDKPSDRPAMMCGLVARVTDPIAAEAGLSRCAESLARALRPPTSDNTQLTRNRMMIDFGHSRYLDPEGGFFTFGLTDHAAVLLLEIDGDPAHPRVEDEMRLCLGHSDNGRPSSATQGTAQRHLLPSGGAIALWFDATRCFADMPKDPSAQTRYQQLERYLDFDLSLVVQPGSSGQLEFVGQYAYSAERFHEGGANPPVIDLLSKLGPSDAAGIPGRLMDRCADTLDFDSLIEHLRMALSNPPDGGSRATIRVVKKPGSAREAQFVVTAQYDPQAGPPLIAALRSLSLF